MKYSLNIKKILILVLLLLLLPSVQIKAFYILNNYTSLINGNSYTLEIKATPKDRENGVKVSLITTGVRITDFEVFNIKDFVTVNPDCTNGEFFTDNRICLTLVKDNPIVDDESLGFLTFKVLDNENFSIVKAEGNAYSDGETLREDLDSVENKTVTTTKNNITIGGFNIDTEDDLIIFSGIGLSISLTFFIVSMIIILFRRKNNPI